jgi:ribosome-associated translation inhibitor RaiA
MLFQLRTDNHIRNSEDLASQVEAVVQAGIVSRLGDRLRRVEVYLEDVNAHKKGDADIRCTVEVHLAGRPAVAAEHRAGDMDEAVDGAVERVMKVLDHQLGRVDGRAGNTSAAG